MPVEVNDGAGRGHYGTGARSPKASKVKLTPLSSNANPRPTKRARTQKQPAADSSKVALHHEQENSNEESPLSASGTDPRLLAARIGILWPEDALYYKAEVVGYNARKHKYCVRYDDGAEEWLSLDREQFKWLCPRGKSAGADEQLKEQLNALGASNAPAGPVPAPRMPKEALRSGTDKAPQGAAAVGRRVTVYCHVDGEFYRAEVLCFDRLAKRHHVLYDDGEDEWLSLPEEHCSWQRTPRQQAAGAGAQSALSVGLKKGQAMPKGRKAIGWLISVYRLKEMAFHQGKVVGYDAASGKHLVRFEATGKLAHLLLANERVKWVFPPQLETQGGLQSAEPDASESREETQAVAPGDANGTPGGAEEDSVSQPSAPTPPDATSGQAAGWQEAQSGPPASGPTQGLAQLLPQKQQPMSPQAAQEAAAQQAAVHVVAQQPARAPETVAPAAAQGSVAGQPSALLTVQQQHAAAVQQAVTAPAAAAFALPNGFRGTGAAAASSAPANVPATYAAAVAAPVASAAALQANITCQAPALAVAPSQPVQPSQGQQPPTATPGATVAARVQVPARPASAGPPLAGLLPRTAPPSAAARPIPVPMQAPVNPAAAAAASAALQALGVAARASAAAGAAVQPQATAAAVRPLQLPGLGVLPKVAAAGPRPVQAAPALQPLASAGVAPLAAAAPGQPVAAAAGVGQAPQQQQLLLPPGLPPFLGLARPAVGAATLPAAAPVQPFANAVLAPRPTAGAAPQLQLPAAASTAAVAHSLPLQPSAQQQEQRPSTALAPLQAALAAAVAGQLQPPLPPQPAPATLQPTATAQACIAPAAPATASAASIPTAPPAAQPGAASGAQEPQEPSAAAAGAPQQLPQGQRADGYLAVRHLTALHPVWGEARLGQVDLPLTIKIVACREPPAPSEEERRAAEAATRALRSSRAARKRKAQLPALQQPGKRLAAAQEPGRPALGPPAPVQLQQQQPQLGGVGVSVPGEDAQAQQEAVDGEVELIEAMLARVAEAALVLAVDPNSMDAAEAAAHHEPEAGPLIQAPLAVTLSGALPGTVPTCSADLPQGSMSHSQRSARGGRPRGQQRNRAAAALAAGEVVQQRTGSGVGGQQAQAVKQNTVAEVLASMEIGAMDPLMSTLEADVMTLGVEDIDKLLACLPGDGLDGL